MTVDELSRIDARRIAVRAQLLDSSRPAELLDVVRHLTLLELRARIRPREDLALYLADMAEWPGRGKLRDWQESNRWAEGPRPAVGPGDAGLPR